MAILLAFIFYNAIWVYISYIRYTSLNYSVYDLGLNYERIWQVFHGSLTSFSQFVNYFSTDFIVVLLSPLSFTGQLYSLLAVQLIALDVSAIIIYKISMKLLENRWEATAITIAFLYYPPLAGITWFDFHFQIFFIPFFLGGYFLYLKHRYIASFVLMIFGGTVYFPYALFPLIFSITVIFYDFIFKQDDRRLYDLVYGTFLLLASAIILVMGYLVEKGVRYYNFITSQFGGSSVSTHTPFHIFITLFLIFALVIFLPLFSKKWLPFFIPFFALVLLSQNIYFLYPALLHRQYGGLYIPFIFLGIIDLIVASRASQFRDVNRRKRMRNFLGRTSKHVATIVLVVIIFSALFLQPYGPINGTTSDNFKLNHEISQSNLSQLYGLQSVVSLIPDNASNVLVQNNLPEVFPRALYNGLILDAPLTQFVNFSIYSIANDVFNASGNGQVGSYQIKYVLMDYNSNQFTSGNPSLFIMSHMMYDSGYYGVYAQNGSIVLLLRGYTSAPVMMSGPPYFK